MIKSRLAAIAAATAVALYGYAYDSPTMGWSSWNTYRVNISDSLIMRQADALIEAGLDSVGYRYINIDDGYFGGRDSATGRMLFHPTRFPNGLRPVVDHIHALGLKAGIYSDAGANTCGNFWDNDTIACGVGLLGHEEQDCQMFFNEIGFDFIKVDFCGADGIQSHEIYDYEPEERYTAIAEAIRATGRQDVRLNVCRWNYPGTWVRDIAASWRTTHDITPSWESVKGIIAENLYLSAYAGNGHFNDMDMLEIGRTLTDEEDITHFAMWCMMSSPLMIGCDLTSLRPSTLELLKNSELIALNQDSLALQAYVAKNPGNGTFILVKDIIEKGGTSRAVAFYNPTDSVRTMSFTPYEAELGGPIMIRDVVNRSDFGILNDDDALTIEVPPHATRVFTLRGTERLPRLRYEAETAYLGSYQEIYDPISTGTAFYMPVNDASGGMVVANLGHTPSNDLQWRDVTVNATGDYNIGITVMGKGNGDLLVFANDEAGVRLKPSGNNIETLVATLRLKKGTNTIRVASTGVAPNIDFMTISL